MGGMWLLKRTFEILIIWSIMIFSSHFIHAKSSSEYCETNRSISLLYLKCCDFLCLHTQPIKPILKWITTAFRCHGGSHQIKQILYLKVEDVVNSPREEQRTFCMQRQGIRVVQLVTNVFQRPISITGFSRFTKWGFWDNPLLTNFIVSNVSQMDNWVVWET